MARAIRITTPTIRLDLTEEEAQTLKMLAGATLGSVTNSRRKHMDRIWEALVKLGLDKGTLDRYADGDITFKDEKDIPD